MKLITLTALFCLMPVTLGAGTVTKPTVTPEILREIIWGAYSLGKMHGVNDDVGLVRLTIKDIEEMM